MDAVLHLDKFIMQNNGIIKIPQAIKAGVSKATFYEYVKRRHLNRIGSGIYVLPEAWEDAMYFIHLKYKQAVFSHETALYLHELTDREPVNYAVTLKSGYNPTILSAAGIKVYTVKKELHEIGIMEMITNFNNKVPVYNKERTICDIVRSRNSMDMQVLNAAFKNYLRSRDKNLVLLMEYAKLLRVDKIIKNYLEVLL